MLKVLFPKQPDESWEDYERREAKYWAAVGKDEAKVLRTREMIDKWRKS